MTKKVSDHADEQLWQELFDHAEPRKRPPEDVERKVRDALHAEWRDIVGQRRRRRTIAWGMAATIALAAVVTALQFLPGSAIGPAPDVASVAKTSGGELLWGEDGSTRLVPLSSGHVFTTGQRLSVGTESRIALRPGEGGSLRLDQNSAVEFVTPLRIALTRGRAYFDSELRSGSQGTAAPLTITTPFGEIEHVGTQFLVDLSSDGLILSVREGSVRLSLTEGAAASQLVNAGERIRVGIDGSVIPDVVESYGGDWAWTETISPSPDMRSRSATDLLRWIERQTGREIRYADERARRMAGIAGSLEGIDRVDLPPMQALRLIEAADLAFRIDAGTILVSQGNLPAETLR